MCGLCGEMNFTGAAASTRAVSAMMDTMAPRGPDGAGLWANRAIALGHRRLKIIDLSERAQQPMVDADLGLSVAFNGCIYNYKELRAELEGKGYRFFSDGDTEVVIKAWHAWGKDAPKRFHGMFAFAIDERDTGRLALVRDRLGIKPLYYSEHGDSIRFASTLPALLAAGDVDTSIDPVALHYYMTFHAVVPPPNTIIKGVRKVEPGTVTVFEPDGRRTTSRFWSLSFARTSEEAQRSSEEWRDAVHAALRTAVDRRMVADVPVGVLLSGGLDSSLIVGLLAEGGQQHLKTFSIGFESVGGEQGDEFQYSDIIAKHFGTEHHQAVHRVGEADRQPAGDDPGHVRADGLLRQCRLLPAVEGSRAPRQGRAVRPGRRRGVRRLSLVSAADGFQRSDKRLRRAFLRPRSCGVRADHGAGRGRRRSRARFRARAFRTARRRRRHRQGAAYRFDRHAGGRPGQARRQHDHGLGPGGARAVPRSRPGGTRGQGSGDGKDQRRRQGRA